jgi:hypothetical protein
VKPLRIILGALAIVTFGGYASLQALAAPTETTRAGSTSVQLAPEFLKALNSLKVTPAPIAPGRLYVRRGGAKAAFPITTGAVDLATVRGEIGHEGGLSLSANGTRAELSAFLIDVTGNRPVLSGLAVVDDNLVGRLPLFDLHLSASRIDADDDFLKVDWVQVTLSQEAADALNQIFGVDAFTAGFPIGTAKIRAFLEPAGMH